MLSPKSIKTTLLLFFSLSFISSLASQNLFAEESAEACNLLKRSKLLSIHPTRVADYATHMVYSRYDEVASQAVANETRVDLSTIEVEYFRGTQDNRSAFTHPSKGSIHMPDELAGSIVAPFIHIHELQHAIDIRGNQFPDFDPDISSRFIHRVKDPKLRVILLMLEGRAYLAMKKFVVNGIQPRDFQAMLIAAQGRSHLLKILQLIRQFPYRDHDFLVAALQAHTENRVPVSLIRESIQRLDERN